MRAFTLAWLAERMSGVEKRDQKAWGEVLLTITAVAFFSWLVTNALGVLLSQLERRVKCLPYEL